MRNREVCMGLGADWPANGTTQVICGAERAWLMTKSRAPIMNLYVFGNGNLAYRDFHRLYVPHLEDCVGQGFSFLLCEFRGADILSLEYLKSETAAVTVFHIGEAPRHRIDSYRTKASAWQYRGGFRDDESRDQAAMSGATHFLAFDFNSSERRTSSTHKLIEQCFAAGKQRLG